MDLKKSAVGASKLAGSGGAKTKDGF